MSFDLNDFQQNPDGTYTKKKTVLQPREIAKKQVKEDVGVYFKHQNIKDVFAEAEEKGYIFIPGNVPSLKNSKQLFKNKHTGKSFITSSDLCKDYISNTRVHWSMFRPRFLKMIQGKQFPLTIKLIFIRDKKKAFDYNNISQIIFDCMTGNAYYPPTRDKEQSKLRTIQREAFAWIKDDDCDHIIPDYSERYGYDPKLPGVIIKVA